MVNRIVDFSVRHKLVVLALVAIGCIAGWWAMATIPVDATPDLSETQVIIYSHWDRSPDIIERQLTYPVVTAMLGAPRVKTVRGISDLGYSYVYVIFEEGTDQYWARARTLENLSSIQGRLPEGVSTELGPDATGLGWVFQYALVDASGTHSLADLRSYQDWTLRYLLKTVPGVADVAAVGGFTRQYQVNLDPNRLEAYRIPISRVIAAVREGNSEASGRVLEFGGSEYMIRGQGSAKSIGDFENISVGFREDGSSIRIKDLGQVTLGPDMRRGVSELDGRGEAVSGIVIMRSGENASAVIDRVKARIREIEPSLPAGVTVVPIYDRSLVIHRAISNSKYIVVEVLLTVSVIILIFLWHFPSAIIPLITIPVTLLISFAPFRLMGMSANIMSLAGIAIAFGELIDASIVVVEQTHKKLELHERTGRAGHRRDVVLSAVKEVAGPTFFALLIIAIAFLPVLTLEGQEGRLFRPLAYSKTLAMIVAAILAITLDPVLRLLLLRTTEYNFKPLWLSRCVNALLVGRIRPEERHPISHLLSRLYEPALRWALRHRWIVIGTAAGLVLATIPLFLHLGSEFMPPLDEGSILYMPSTMPGVSIRQAEQLLSITDHALAQFPEVDHVLGKAGRAETATDPAPLSMLETVITLKPRSAWRHQDTWYSPWAPEWLAAVLRHITPDTISPEELVRQMDRAVKVPGLTNAWTMPIRGRTDMLSTGIRTPVGLKISGDDPRILEEIGRSVQAQLAGLKGTRSVFAERTAAGHFLDVDWDREQLASRGVTMAEAQLVLQSAIGGENISTVTLGRERYPVDVRYQRDFRSDIGALQRLRIQTADGRQVSIGEVAKVHASVGPSMIRDENGLVTSYIYVDLAGRDPQSYVEAAKQLIREKVTLPPGYALTWSGQFEAMERLRHRLMYVIPITLAIIVILLYSNTRSLVKTTIVLMAVPFSAVGAVCFVYLAGYNMSIAVWVGLIALLGVDAETGVFMLLYLDLAYEEAKARKRLQNVFELREAIVEGAAKRLRPKFMTFATTCLGLLPIMWSTGTGADVMKRIAAPMVGGIFTSFLLELFVYPCVYEAWRWHSQVRQGQSKPLEQEFFEEALH